MLLLGFNELEFVRAVDVLNVVHKVTDTLHLLVFTKGDGHTLANSPVTTQGVKLGRVVSLAVDAHAFGVVGFDFEGDRGVDGVHGSLLGWFGLLDCLSMVEIVPALLGAV